MTKALLASTFVIATSGLVFELVAGTAASYLLGDSVTQFSTVIGAYLFAMGAGSYLARFIDRDLVRRFIGVEILVGLAGGFSSTILFLSFERIDGFRVVLYAVVSVVGILVGLEIPLMLRILKDRLEFRDLVSNVLSLDYLGALAASILFPLWLVPQVGLLRGAMLFGMAHVGVGLAATWVFREPRTGHLRVGAALALAALGGGCVVADRVAGLADETAYKDEVIYARSTKYQRIVITRWKDELRLYLNGHLQFGSRDEYRYHEALVHPGLARVENPRKALVLGGGDGMAAREILKDHRVVGITLVDLDGGMTDLFRDHEFFSSLNDRSLRSSKLKIVNEDAFIWLEKASDLFDFIVVDLPDPTNYSLGKLYTTAFYRRLAARLAPGGAAAIQCTSPLFARRAYWCIVETLKAAGLDVAPYHAYVPSFGEWGFVLAGRGRVEPGGRFPEGLKFVSAATVLSLFEFPPDMAPLPVEVNRLTTQILVRYYETEWRRYAE